MPVSDPIIPKRVERGHTFRYALIALVLAFIGLGCAAYRYSLDEPPSPTTKDKIQQSLVDAENRLSGQHENTEDPHSGWRSLTKRLGLTATVMGFFAMIFGSVSWLMVENRRWTFTALSIAVATMAWSHVVVYVASTVALVVLIVLLSALS